MLNNKVEEGRLVRPDPRLKKILAPKNLHIDTTRQVSEDGALIFGPCYCCQGYERVIGMDPLEGGKCTLLAVEPLVKPDDGIACTAFQPTEEALKYVQAKGR